MNFFEKFDNFYYDKLNFKVNWKKRNVEKNLYQRGEGYRIIFRKLAEKNLKEYNILETGVLRNVGNWKDGQSTFLFQEFLRLSNYKGKIETVDIDIKSVEVAKRHLDPFYTEVFCSDSIKWLAEHHKKNICLYHLDSYDVKWPSPEKSAAHHLKEFKAIEDYLEPGTLVMIDDNTRYMDKRTGKGMDIYEYLKSKGKMPIYDEYQIIYEF